jgi:hypothetical protein
MSVEQQNDRNSRVTKNIQIMKTKIIKTDELITRFNNTKKELDAKTQELTLLKTQAHSLVQFHNHAQHQLNAVKNENEQLKKQIIQLQEASKELETLKNQLQQHKQLVTELNGCKAELTREQIKVSKLVSQVNHLNNELQKKTEQFSEKQSNNDNQHKAKIVETTIISSDTRELENMLDSTQKELESARLEIHQLRSQDPALYQRTSSSDAEIHRLQIRITTLEKENVTLLNDRQKLNDKKLESDSVYKKKLAELRKENKKFSQSSIDSGTANELKKSNASLKQSNSSLMEKNTTLQHKVREMEHRITKYEFTEKQLRQELDSRELGSPISSTTTTGNQQQLRQQIDHLKAQLTQKQKEIVSREETINRERRELQRQIRESGSHSISSSNGNDINGGYSMIIRENEKLQEKVTTLKERCRSLEQQKIRIRNVFLSQIQPLLFSDSLDNIPHAPISTPAPTTTSIMLQPTQPFNDFDSGMEFGGPGGFDFGEDHFEVPVAAKAPTIMATPSIATPQKRVTPTTTTTKTTTTQKKKRRLDNAAQNGKVTKKRRTEPITNATPIPDIPPFSIERKTQEKTEVYVQRLITTFLDTYLPIFEVSDNSRALQKVYKMANKLCSAVWQVCHGDTNSQIGSVIGVKTIVKGLSDVLVQSFIMKQVNHLQINIIQELVVLMHVYSPVHADIFSVMFKMLEAKLFPARTSTADTTVNYNCHELQAFCSLVSMLSQIDVNTLPAKHANKKALKLVTIAKPFNLQQNLCTLLFDLFVSLLQRKIDDTWDVAGFKILFSIISSNPNVIQMNNSYIGQTIYAVLQQLMYEIDMKSNDEGLVGWEQQFQQVLQWIMKVLDKKKLSSSYQMFSSEGDDFIDTIIDKLVNAVQTISANANSVCLTDVEHEIINSFVLIAYFRNDWLWIYNHILFRQLWPIVKTSRSSTSVVIAIIGALTSMRLNGVIHVEDDKISKTAGIPEVLNKLFIVLSVDIQEEFPILTQFCAAEYLCQFQCINTEVDERMELVSQWIDRNTMFIKENKETIEKEFTSLYHLFAQLHKHSCY